MGFLQTIQHIIRPNATALLEAKAGAVRQSTNLPKVEPYYQGIPRYSDWSEENSVRNGLFLSSWVYRCASLRAQCLGIVPWVVEKRLHDDVWERVVNHPLERLLKQPNEYWSGKQLIELSSYHRDLGGNSYWHVIMGNGVPQEIWPLKPDFVRPIPDMVNYLQGYYLWIGGTPFVVNAGEILHLMHVNPVDNYIGLAPMRVAWTSVDTDIMATKWNRNSMDNRSVTDGVFSVPEMLTSEQWTEFKRQIKEQHQGVENAHTPWIVGGGATFDHMMRSPVEQDFIESRKFSREEIAAIFGIPTSKLTGQKSASHSLNSGSNESETRDMWHMTIEPLLIDYEAKFNAMLIPYYDAGAARGDANLRVRYDLSTITALQENYADKVKSFQILVVSGVTPRGANRVLELGFAEEELPAEMSEMGGAVPGTPGGAGKTPPALGNPTGNDNNVSGVDKDVNLASAKKMLAEHADAHHAQKVGTTPADAPDDHGPNQPLYDNLGLAYNKPSVKRNPPYTASQYRD